MRKLPVLIVFAVLLFVAMFGLMNVAIGQRPDRAAPGGGAPVRETQGENVRELLGAQEADPQQPDIGFIDSPSATCYQPDPAQDACYINWYYASVNAAPNYMITMTMEVNAIGPVANVQGFFQTSMYVPYSMLGEGIKVACGDLGEAGRPRLGKAYAWTIRGRDSAGLKAANYGTVYCPAYAP